MSTDVKEILQEIEALGEKDRLRLERALARRFEREWAAHIGEARKVAKRRRIGQAEIDQAIERHRYGQ